jgi:hypothetical protein
MQRFTLAADLGLLCVPTESAPRPKPPSISVYYGGVCLIEIRWVRPDLDGGSSSSVSGALVNRSEKTLNSVFLQFPLISGRALAGTTAAYFSSQIPPGATWVFRTPFTEYDGHTIITRIDSGSLEGTLTTNDGTRRFSQAISFDPLFSPDIRKERKDWDAIHGRRAR